MSKITQHLCTVNNRNLNTTTRKNPRRKACALAAALVGLGMYAGQGQAGPLSWDQTGGGVLGGTGNWTTAATNWWDGASDIAWDSSDAIFGGAVGTVTISGDTGVSANSLTFNTPNYIIAGTNVATDILNLTGSGLVTANANASVSAGRTRCPL